MTTFRALGREEGLNRQALIDSVLHKYARGLLLEKDQLWEFADSLGLTVKADGALTAPVLKNLV